MSCIRELSEREKVELQRMSPLPILKALGEAIDEHMPVDEKGENDEWQTLRDGLDRMSPIVEKMWHQALHELRKERS